MTNLGAVKLHEEMEDLIDSFEAVPTPPNTHVKISCAMVTFRNQLRLDFCNISRSTSFEMHFLYFPDFALFLKFSLINIYLTKWISDGQ
jgi:hypothetical protein